MIPALGAGVPGFKPRNGPAVADLVAFLATSEAMFFVPIYLLFNECHAVFIVIVVVMPLDASDRSISLEKAEHILLSFGVPAFSRGWVLISICQGSFEFAVPNPVCLLDE